MTELMEVMELMGVMEVTPKSSNAVTGMTD
jgi:hypothetical protein